MCRAARLGKGLGHFHGDGAAPEDHQGGGQLLQIKNFPVGQIGDLLQPLHPRLSQRYRSRKRSCWLPVRLEMGRFSLLVGLDCLISGLELQTPSLIANFLRCASNAINPCFACNTGPYPERWPL